MARALLGEDRSPALLGRFPTAEESPEFAMMMGLLGGFMDPLYGGPLQFTQHDGSMLGPPGMGVAEAFYANPNWGGMDQDQRDQYATNAHNLFGAYY